MNADGVDNGDVLVRACVFLYAFPCVSDIFHYTILINYLWIDREVMNMLWKSTI